MSIREAYAIGYSQGNNLALTSEGKHTQLAELRKHSRLNMSIREAYAIGYSQGNNLALT
jgi:predicted esterase